MSAQNNCLEKKITKDIKIKYIEQLPRPAIPTITLCG